MSTVILISSFSIITGLSFFFFIRLRSLRRKIETEEKRVIWLYFEKINKIPALIEIVRKYSSFDDIFVELIHLHKIAIISNVSSIYDLLEFNSRIHREFLFLMKVSAKIHDLHTDGNFLYVRDFIMFYETNLNKEIMSINRDIHRYNRLLKKQKFTVIWTIFPREELIPLTA